MEWHMSRITFTESFQGHQECTSLYLAALRRTFPIILKKKKKKGHYKGGHWSALHVLVMSLMSSADRNLEKGQFSFLIAAAEKLSFGKKGIKPAMSGCDTCQSLSLCPSLSLSHTLILMSLIQH